MADRSLQTLLRTLAPDADDAVIENYARGIEISARLLSVNNLPRANRTGKKDGARIEAKGFCENIRTLHDYIDTMHADTLEGLRAQGLEPFALQIELRQAFEKTVEALRHDLAHTNATGGRPRDRQAESVSDDLARTYHQLTGQPPQVWTKEGQAYGPFFSFVASAFTILRIGASPESQGRAASRRWKKTPSQKEC